MWVQYDGAGRLEQLTTPTGDLVYSYDAGTGQVQAVAAPGATVTYAYDGPLPVQENSTGTLLHELLFGRYAELTVFGTDLNDHLLFGSMTTASRFAERRNALGAAGADLEDDRMGVIHVASAMSTVPMPAGS